MEGQIGNPRFFDFSSSFKVQSPPVIDSTCWRLPNSKYPTTIQWDWPAERKNNAFQMTHETYPGQMASHHFTSEHHSHLSTDAARFGQSYMSKLGWDPSKGLGASGDGMKSHLKVSQKLDMLGIGAAHQKDPHGIAWKQNKEFEALLQRLNAQDGQDSTSKHVLGEFVRPEHSATDVHSEEDKELNPSPKKEKKRKRKEGGHVEDGKDKKKRKRDKRQDEDVEDSAAVDSSKPASPHIDPPAPSPDTVSSILQTRQKGRPMACVYF